MLMDVAHVVFSGGHGGRGNVSFGKKEHSGPDGGNGGRGGCLYVKATSDVTLLNQFSQETEFEAEDGNPGRRYRQSGKDGKDLTILLPIGTSGIDEETNEPLFELTKISEVVLVCEGGKGGRGNFEFRSSRRTTPEFAQTGLRGQKRKIKLELKLIANYGLIGLPNAGKSSLLNELTAAKARVANYAFTTLSPNLGVIKGRIIADIPGLIEGASEGKGLGFSFLRHIEKVGVLIHCISVESEDPIKDYEAVRTELGKYNHTLLSKPEIVVITKSDLV